MHRSVFSALAPTISQQFNLTTSDIGMLQASQLAIYLTGQLPSGKLADAVGGIEVLLAGLLLWSFGTGLTAAAEFSQYTIPILLCSRLIVGLFSSCIMPAVSAMSAAEFPKPNRAFSVSLIYACFNIGGVVGLGVAPVLADKLGWTTAFGLAWGLGMLWSGIGWYILRDRWAAGGALRAKLHSATHLKEQASTESVPWYRQPRTLLQVGVLCWTHAVIGACFFVLQNWIPMYLTSRGCTTPALLGALSGAPWLAAALAALLAGTISDRLLAASWDPLTVRRIMHTISTLGCSLSLLPLVLVPTLPPPAAAACMAASLACYGASFSGFHAYVQDTTSNDAGTMLGITNSCGVVMGIAANLATGWVVDATGSYTAVFAALAALSTTSWALFLGFMKGEKIYLS